MRANTVVSCPGCDSTTRGPRRARAPGASAMSGIPRARAVFRKPPFTHDAERKLEVGSRQASGHDDEEAHSPDDPADSERLHSILLFMTPSALVLVSCRSTLSGRAGTLHPALSRCDRRPAPATAGPPLIRSQRPRLCAVAERAPHLLDDCHTISSYCPFATTKLPTVRSGPDTDLQLGSCNTPERV